MKRFSVTSISLIHRKLGSLLFIILFLCGVGYQTTEVAELRYAQIRGIHEQTGINQASVLVSSSQLAMPRAVGLLKELRHTESFSPLLVLPLNPDVVWPVAHSLFHRNNVHSVPQPGRYYGMLPLPHAPPALS